MSAKCQYGWICDRCTELKRDKCLCHLEGSQLYPNPLPDATTDQPKPVSELLRGKLDGNCPDLSFDHFPEAVALLERLDHMAGAYGWQIFEKLADDIAAYLAALRKEIEP